MRICVSEVTTLPSSFADDVANFARAGCPAMEVWLTKLEQHLEGNSPADARKLVADNGLTLAAASYQGGLLLSQGEQRRASFDHFRRRLELCQFFGIETLLIVADFVRTVDQTALERAVVSLAEAARWAAGFGVTLALEFRGTDTFCSSLDTAVRLVAACGEPNVGINLDVFHYYKGPSKFEDLELLNQDNLRFVQFSDLAGVPRELASDSDRVLPGDGEFRLAAIVEKLRTIGYTGWVSLELMNPMLWQSKPRQVVELGYAAMRRLVG